MEETMEKKDRTNKENLGKRKSLRWSMVRMLLFGWFFPLLMMIFIIMFLVMGKFNTQMENMVTASLDKAAEIFTMQLKDCETASKNASYMPVIFESYEEYKKTGSRRNFSDKVTVFLKQQYKFNPNCKTAILFLADEPEQLYFTFNNSNNATYKDVEYFQKNAEEKIIEVAKELDTATTIVNVNGRMYMVRNLVNSKFKPYAVLSLELDERSLLQSMESVWGYQNAALFWNEELVLTGQSEDAKQVADTAFMEKMQNRAVCYEQERGKYSYVIKKIRIYQGDFYLKVQLDNTVIHAEMRSVQYFFLILSVFMIPLVIQVIRFFHNKVTVPVQEVIKASEEVKEGRLGIQMDNPQDSVEFYQMRDAFNHMSAQLKNQFDKIYSEEIALRDAKIMALQSQINPHFLNNTLEIINWEARLNENYKVSAMIEALSTMLEATMNRKAKQFHSLAEEMAYADAYLYIISQRFGEKFKCIKKIDESLLDVKVPRLIIQPIVENAVEHGIDITREGYIEIRLSKREDEYLCIEVEDSGHLTKEEREKIDRLLSEEINPVQEKRVSLGIRNVAQRIKMIYGSTCGLFITGNEKQNTISTILIKMGIGTEQ